MQEDIPRPTDGDEQPAASLPMRGKTHGWLIAGVFALLPALAVAGIAIGGEFGQIVLTGVESLPLMVLAMLAYLGVERTWAKGLTLLWLLALVLLVQFIYLVTSLAALEAATNLDATAGRLQAAAVLVGIGISPLIGAAAFFRTVRLRLRRFLPIDPDSFVHTVALATVITFTLASFAPLLVLGVPPLLSTVEEIGAEGGIGGRGSSGALRDDLYALGWMIPATIFAVGFGIRRSFRESINRLGLVRPTGRQMAAAVGLAIGLVVVMQLVDTGIGTLWESMGWALTDAEAFEKLIAHAFSPVGALVIGITAGLGEELAVRGVLQPRLGILLSNIFFTGLHAAQYNWDALLSVFLIGLALGLIRQRSNTTTSAVVHGGYDFIVIMMDVFQIPGLS